MLFGVRASQSRVSTASPDRKKIRDGQKAPEEGGGGGGGGGAGSPDETALCVCARGRLQLF